MTKSNPTGTRAIVRAYYDAWSTGDMAGAGETLADEVVNPAAFNGYTDAPVTRAAYLEVLSTFYKGVTGFDLISELYGDDEATLVYDVHTATPAGTIRSAEHFRLRDGRIHTVVLIFDTGRRNPAPPPVPHD